MGLKPGDRSKGRNSPDAFEDPGAEKTPTFPSACAGGAPQKERGNGTSLSKAEESRGEVSLLSANPAPPRARDNQTRQGFRLSSSALLPQTLGLYRQGGGFCEELSTVAPIPLKVKSSCAFIVTGVYGDHVLSTCTEIKRANQKL